jgi:hypothetical protein
VAYVILDGCHRHHAKVRAVGEHGAATFKQWDILRKARCSSAV